MHSLPIFLTIRDRPVILVGTGDATAAKRRLLERAGAIVVGEEDDAAFAIVVDDDGAVARLKRRGVLVNATDRPELCDFTLPAIVERGPVVIAVGTGGASAGLAKVLRQRLEAWLPARLGRLAERMAAAKAAMRAKWPDADARRWAIDAALAENGPLDPLAGRDDVDGWLAEPGATAPSRIEIVRLSSDDPDDLTLRAARLLGQADRLYVTGDVPAAILVRARADAVRLAGSAPAVPLAGLSVVVEACRA